MKIEIFIWIAGVVILTTMSALGWLATWPVVIVVVPALVFALGCGMAFIMGGRMAQRINLYRFLCSVLIALVGLTQFPLRLGFLASKRGLSALASDLNAGKTPSFPVRAGLYVIRSATVSEGGNVCLWTDTNPHGRIGFVCGDNVNFTDIWSVQNLDCVWWYVVLD